jgi:hypothetical protein
MNNLHGRASFKQVSDSLKMAVTTGKMQFGTAGSLMGGLVDLFGADIEGVRSARPGRGSKPFVPAHPR